MRRIALFSVFWFFAFTLSAQKSEIQMNPDLIPVTFHGLTVPLGTYVEDPNAMNEKAKDEKLGPDNKKKHWTLNETVNPNALPKNGDLATQRSYNRNGTPKALTQNWAGMGYTGVNPADPCVDVGPNHVIQMINGGSGSYITVWDKTGNVLRAQIYLDNWVGTGAGSGDPIVLYDERADRWLLSEFSNGGNNNLVAISQTPDPLGAWYTYSYNAPNFPDYPKYSIWENSYIITTNENSAALYALDRTAMLGGAGGTAQRFAMTNFGTIGFQAATPVSLNGTTNPPGGQPAYVMRMRDDAWTGAATDALELWEFDIDHATPANTSLTQVQTLGITPHESELCGYTSFQCFPQPGTGVTLDPLRELLMNRIHYRNFGTHESIVCSHVTDVDGTDHGGIRWYELRRTGGTGGTWTIYQESTYSPDGDNRWMPTIGISATGNIGLAYNVSSGTTFPSIRYTGRLECDPLNTMTVVETDIATGTASNASNRWGDYNAMGLDPSDGETFWCTAKYNTSTQWSTRVAAFDIGSCSPQVSYGGSAYTVDEPDANVPNGCLDYYILNVPIQIPVDPSQPADVTITITGGTATNGVDYTIPILNYTLDNPTLLYNVEIWVYDDNYVEGNETINLAYTLNANGGNATTGSINQTVTITITDDDLSPALMPGAVVTVFQDDFEDGTLAPFTTVNNAGGANDPWQVGNNAAAASGAYAVPVSNVGQFAWINDDACNCVQDDVDLTFPSVDLTNYNTAALSFYTYFEDNTYQGNNESADLEVSVNGGGFTTIAPLVASTIDGAWITQNFSLTPYVGNASVILRIKYSDGAGWLYGCTVDDVLITGEGPIVVETDVNTGAGQTANLGANETVHFYDPITSDVMMSIVNTSAFDYGCVTVEVDRDGTAPTAIQFNSATVADFLHGKTYTVTPTNANPTGTYDVTVYYEEAEVAGWEAITGNSRNNAEIIKVAGANRINDVTPANYASYTIDNIAATVGAFFSDVTFTSSFTNGFSGFGVGIYNLTTVTVTHTVVVTNPSCAGGNDGSIVVTAASGTAPYQYSIDNGVTWQASNTFNGLSAGSYQVIAEDASPAQSVMSTEVLTDPPAVLMSSVTTNENCGQSDGTITITGSGGTGALTYSIDNGVTFQASGSFTGLTAGSYNIVTEDANGCQATGTAVVGSTAGPTASSVHTDENCGQADGTITVTGAAGTAPLTYSIDNGVTFQAGTGFTGLAAGTYDIVVEDANGCQGTGSETISNTAGPSISNISSVDPTCNGGSDGSFTVNATGGTAPLTYSSDNGVTFQAGNSFTGVSAGTYNVVVEDANGCQVNSTVTLTDPTAVAYTSSTTDENCGAGDGTISLTGSGGTGALNYSSDGGATFQVTGNFTGLAAGVYNIVVEDANGCQATGTVTVGVAAGGVAISSTTDVDPTCNGGNDGSITVNASGGAAPLSYSIDGGVTFQAGTSFTGLSAGSYNMVVEDANGCQDATTATVTDPAAGTVSASSTAENCGSFDGTITMTGGGGTPPYTYSVDGGVTFQASNNFTGLVAGLYNIVVEDANGCQAAGTQTVSSIGGANITNVATSDPSCNGDVDGTITITASGGTAPLTYSIDGGATFQASGSFTGLGAATYAIAVVDANGCIAGSSATLTNPAAVTYSANNTDPTCNGGADGQIVLTGAGGTGALSYSIDGGVTFQATGVFTGLAAANYNVVVEDANGCQGTGTETLNDPAAMTYSASSTNEVCGSSDGTLTITSSSGTAPLSYSIDGGISFQGTGSFINLTAGAFNVVVEDANGCQVAGVETVNSTGGASITTVATADPSCSGGTDGTITITASGGTAPLTYSIDGGGTFQASNSFTGLGAGSYAVVVADAGGCNTGGSATLTNPAVITYTASSTDEACGAADGTLTLVGSGGTGAFTYSIDGGATFQAGITFTGLTAGAFNVVIEDANGCQTLGAEIVNSTGGASISTVVAVDPTCNGDSDGSITITATGGTAPLAYSIDGGATFQASNVFTGLASGVYILVVDDANGCAGGGSATLNDPAVVSYTAVATDETCGAADGSVVLSGAGGTGAFNYSIDGGSTFQASGSFAGLTGGTYNVVVEDANGCQATGTEVVGTIGGATILAVLSTNPLCNGDVNGYISITANGGTAPLQYSIDGGATFQATIAFSGLSAGTYTLVVEDASGCQTTTTQVLTNPAAITATVAATGANCGANDGSATATASGGTGALTYSWDDGASQTTASATNLAAGTYTCTITDANGCTTTVTATVTNSNAPTISISSSNVTCNGDGDGGASATVSGGTAPFTYAWDDPTNQATAAATGLGGGMFTVTVTDATGCSVTQSVIIAEPVILTNSSSVMSTTCGYANGVAISTPSGGTAPYSYQWDDAGNQSLSAAVSLAGGTYTVTISDANGCVLTDNVTIGDSDSLVITVDITHESCDGFADGTIVTAMVGGSPPYMYTWNNGAATAAIADLAAGTYTVTVQDAVGCEVHDLIPLLAENVDCITIPTAISPNGDGANDTWMIEGLDLYPDAEVEIYNRWGALLFSEKGYQHDWGGTFQDEALPAGVYYFVVKVSEEEVYTGSITVLR